MSESWSATGRRQELPLPLGCQRWMTRWVTMSLLRNMVAEVTQQGAWGGIWSPRCGVHVEDARGSTQWIYEFHGHRNGGGSQKHGSHLWGHPCWGKDPTPDVLQVLIGDKCGTCQKRRGVFFVGNLQQLQLQFEFECAG